MENKVKRILIATAFPTHGAGSGALVTTQAKSYVEDGYDVTIITGNNRSNFDKLDGVKYHIVPFTSEEENPERIEGQAPFNYFMFTTHTESKANFWQANLQEVDTYCKMFKDALQDEVKNYNPDIIHAQHNWLLSSEATKTGKPVVTTIHGTDLMGYKKAKILLAQVQEQISEVSNSAQKNAVEEIFKRSNSYEEIVLNTKKLLDNPEYADNKKDIKNIIDLYSEERKYKFYISEAENSARNSDKIIVISDAQQKDFNELFPYAANKVELIENGYDTKTFYIDEEAKNGDILSTLKAINTEDGIIPTDYDHMALFVGKFADFKGIDSFLTASKIYTDKLKEQDKKIITVVVGSGALDNTLINQSKKLGLDSVYFTGRLNHTQIRALLNKADFEVVDSRNEPFGLVVTEATATGTPVIGSNSGGITGILNVNKEPLPEEDVINTPLGVLVTPLPERPTNLTDEDIAKLDLLTCDYVLGDNDTKNSIVEEVSDTFGMESSDANDYLTQYNKNTQAVAEAALKIVGREFTYDSQELSEYTKNTYGQPIIKDRLIELFNTAIDEHYNEINR